MDRERNPPPRPAPLEFPSYVPASRDSPLTRQHMKSLCNSILSVRRPLDIQDSHLAHLNIHLKQEVDLRELVPHGEFQSRPLLFDNDLTSMLNELSVENEDAYREILRLPPLEGKKKPRLTYSRNFYTSLEDMSRYWDDSKDNYYEVESKEDDSPPKSDTQNGNPWPKPRSEGNDVEMEDATETDQRLPNDSGSDDRTSSTEITSTPAGPKMKKVYKGHRIGNGEQMSPGIRVGAIRNLLKMAVHKFNCRDYEISLREKLRIRTITIPSVYYNFCVAKLPADMKLARARMVEGPVLAVHARSEVRFKSRDGLLTPTSDFMGERFDFFREIGSLLLLAKQRAREGQKLSKEPGEDQWWATKSRWGGGETKWGQLASEVYEDDDPSWGPEERRLQLEKREREEQELKNAEAAATTDLNNLKPEDLMSDQASSSERPKKKKKASEDNAVPKNKSEYRDGKRLMYVQPLRRKWYQEWLKIRPNTPNWDEKVIFRRIGRQGQGEGAAGWDDVYMISSVNHHACILRLRVHKKYIEWLESDKVSPEYSECSDAEPMATSDGGQEHILFLSRSRWFDLFEVEERKELLVGIWRILCWVNRDEVPREEHDKMEVLRRQQDEDAGDHQMEI